MVLLCQKIFSLFLKCRCGIEFTLFAYFFPDLFLSEVSTLCVERISTLNDEIL